MYFYRTRIVCHWIIYGYSPIIRSFVYCAFVSCIVCSLRVSCVLSFAFSVQFVRCISFVRSGIVRSFRVSFVRFVYRAFVRCVFRIVRWFHFVRVSCVHFAYRAFASCIVSSFRVSCVFRIARVKRSIAFRSFAFGAYCKLIRSMICST